MAPSSEVFEVRADRKADSTQSLAGATVMGALVLALTWMCATGSKLFNLESSPFIWSAIKLRTEIY